VASLCPALCQERPQKQRSLLQQSLPSQPRQRLCQWEIGWLLVNRPDFGHHQDVGVYRGAPCSLCEDSGSFVKVEFKNKVVADRDLTTDLVARILMEALKGKEKKTAVKIGPQGEKGKSNVGSEIRRIVLRTRTNTPPAACGRQQGGKFRLLSIFVPISSAGQN
jgi:hypothetical protein